MTKNINRSLFISFFLVSFISMPLFGFNTIDEFSKTKPLCDEPSNSLMCQQPTNFSHSNSGAMFDFWWNGIFNATGYQLKIGEEGFDLNTNPPIFETETTAALFFGVEITEGAKNYEAYIRTICNNGDTSNYSGPFLFYAPPSCGDTFYDSGGPDGDMSDTESESFIICPDAPGKFVQLVINELDIDPCCGVIILEIDNDNFIIPSDGSHQSVYSSFAQDGCLTFNFFNFNDPPMGAGWDISIDCATCPTAPAPFVRMVSNDEVYLNWNVLGSIQNIEWEISHPGFLPFTGNADYSGSAFLSSASLNIDGLTSNTPYELYIRNQCGAENSLPTDPVFFKTAPSCDEPFYDLGEPDEPLSNHIAQTVTTAICPEQSGDAIEINFNSFDIGNDGSKLTVFDGDSNASPTLLTLQGTNIPTPIASSHPTGCLAFRYSRADTLVHPGWDADVNCISCPPINGFNIENTGMESAEISWTPTLNATGYEWEIGDPGFEPGTGNDLITGTSPSNENFAGANGLQRNTVYEINVRGLCGPENGSYYHPYLFSTHATCGDFFFDPGGPNTQYENNSYLITTICSSEPNDPVTVQFNLFNTQGCCDFLSVFDGENISSNLITAIMGSDSPGSFTATNPSGCLTFEFTSDETIAGNGWEASILCNATPTIENTNPDVLFDLFPNPASDKVNININGNSATNQTLEVRDVNGILVFEKEIDGQQFSIPSYTWPSGTYFVVLKNGERAVTKRIVKSP